MYICKPNMFEKIYNITLIQRQDIIAYEDYKVLVFPDIS